MRSSPERAEAIMYVGEPAPVRACVPAQLTKAVVMSNYASRLIWETGTLIQICCLPANAQTRPTHSHGDLTFLSSALSFL